MQNITNEPMLQVTTAVKLGWKRNELTEVNFLEQYFDSIL